MEHHELVIEIAPDGTVKLEVVGVTGTACMNLTEELEGKIGKVVNRQKKAEYFSNTGSEQTTIKIKADRS